MAPRGEPDAGTGGSRGGRLRPDFADSPGSSLVAAGRGHSPASRSTTPRRWWARSSAVARIPVPRAAWSAVADDARWVTSQTGTGLTRIDPATNTVVAHAGDVPPCSAPVVAFDSIWQAACDADVVLQIDPARNAIVKTIPAQGHVFLVLAANRLIPVGP